MSHNQSNPKDKQTTALNAWFVFSVASLILCLYGTHAVRKLLDPTFDPYRVLGSFYASGSAASHHLNPYRLYPMTWHFHPYSHGPIIYDVNLNPPCVLPLFQLLSIFQIRSDVVVWTAISTVLIILSVATMLAALKGQMQKRQIAWLLLSTSALDTLWYGQDYSLVLILVCLAWLLTRLSKEIQGALLIGIVIAIKPNLGLWPVFLFIAGYKRSAIVSGSVALLLSIFPMFLYGPQIYSQWLYADSQVPHWMFPSDVSLAGVFTRLGSRPVGVLLALALAGTLLAFVRKFRPTQANIAGISICAGILCAPLAWYNYLLFAAPLFALKKWRWMETCAAVLMTFPRVFEDRAMGKGRLLVFVMGLPQLVGICLMLVAFLRRSQTAEVPDSSKALETIDTGQECPA